MSVFDTNRSAWNRMVAGGTQFAKVATDAECRDPLATLDGRNWLPSSVHGLNVLCLAGGGGWQSILYAVAGANVTVVDLSPSMLKQDVEEAARRNLKVTAVNASMHDLSALSDASFDIVHQPVSTCYVPDVVAVYQEVARVLRDGGLYISQHKSPTSLQVVDRTERNQYVLGVRYYHQGPLPTVADDAYRESGTVEFLHRWDDLIGGLCRSGFILEDLREPYRGDETASPGHYKHRGLFVPPYVRMKARRKPRVEYTPPVPGLWTP